MKNATLVINNPEGLEQDIWSDDSNLSENQWKAAIVSLAVEVQPLYDRLSETTGGNGQVYALGDILNLLYSIDVEIKREKI